MKVLVSGTHGFIGRSLVPALETGGHEVVKLVRGDPTHGEIHWDPVAGTIDSLALEGINGVIHLAAQGIAGPGTRKHKALIRDSRVNGTTLLSNALGALDAPPRVMVSASAIGYYGDRGDELLNEGSRSGDDFLANVCKEWEAVTAPAQQAGVRVVNLRSGHVLGAGGGLLGPLLPLFKLGIGARFGSGRQYVSWISIDDEVGAILHALENEAVRGPLNSVAPNPVTNREFTSTLGHILHRPTFLTVPTPLIKFGFGRDLGGALVSSQRVVSERLNESGYSFRHSELEDALRSALNK